MTTLVHVAAPARLLTAGFWRDYVVTMRPYLLFVSGVTGIAGLALAREPGGAAVAALSVVFFLTYGFGQALTDCFQLDTDALSAPYRPLVRGRVRRDDVLAVSAAGLVVSGFTIAAFAPGTLLFCGLAIAGLATYTWFKRRWWSGPWYNAWIVALVLFIAAQTGLGISWREPALLGAVVAAFFGYANFVLVGYYKDLSADRATGYRTFPVVFGLRAAHVVSDLFAGLAVAGTIGAVAALTASAGPRELIRVAGFGLAALGTALMAQWQVHRVRSERRAHIAIGPVVHAYILLLATVAAAARPAWAPLLALFYLGFVATLHRRPMTEQI